MKGRWGEEGKEKEEGGEGREGAERGVKTELCARVLAMAQGIISEAKQCVC